MKKKQFHSPLMIILLISLFLLTEVLWIIYLYRVERNIFQSNINQYIQLAIEEEINAIKENSPDCTIDFPNANRIILEYSLRGKYFRTDTIKEALDMLLNKTLYDFHKESWHMDSIVIYFRRFISRPNFPISFLRMDDSGNVIDRYPANIIPQGNSVFPPQQLGNIERDQLLAWYNFPLTVFLKHQKYGLLLSLLPLLFATYYALLIIKKEWGERSNFRFIEKQVIFIHDLKTPLCTNRDIANRILKNLRNWSSEKIQEKLDISRKQSVRLLKEMQNLTVNSAGRWGGEIENQHFNLKNALEELIHNRQKEHENAHIRLEFLLENPEIFADPFHLIHMVDNLIGNALKYAGEEAEIIVTCSRIKSHHLRISVKDNGPGIPHTQQKKIFRPNYSIHSRNPESHGIGLVYISKIIRQYEGFIRVKSREQEGTEFIIALNPGSTLKNNYLIPSVGLYYYFFIALLFAEAIWMTNLYTAERENVRRLEALRIEDAIFQTNKFFFKWQDTVYFQNNGRDKTITVRRGNRDTTIQMGSSLNQDYVYRRLIYDLRDVCWNIDSVAYHLQKNRNIPFIRLIRTNATGNIIDQYSSRKEGILIPIVIHMPLGYIDGHQMEIQLSYPWKESFKTHKIWLAIAFMAILLSGLFSYLLSSLLIRQRAMICFQRKKVQHFIRELQKQLEHILHVETCILAHYKSKEEYNFEHILRENIELYRKMLVRINYLLDHLTLIQTHRLIYK